MARTREVCTAFSRHPKVYRWLRNVRKGGLAIVLIDEQMNNVRLPNET